MAEEQEESTGKSFKNIIIGLVSTVTLGIGTWVTTKLTGGEDDKAPVQQAAPVINIQNNQTQTAGGGGGKTVIINKGGDGKSAAQPQPKPKKKEGDEFKEEAPKW
jgi:hypothetical protein